MKQINAVIVGLWENSRFQEALDHASSLDQAPEFSSATYSPEVERIAAAKLSLSLRRKGKLEDALALCSSTIAETTTPEFFGLANSQPGFACLSDTVFFSHQPVCLFVPGVSGQLYF